MRGSWTASAEIPSRGWTNLSHDLDIADHGMWAAEQIAGLRDLWPTSWQPEWESDIEHILTIEANSRDRDLLFSALCWPVPGPVVAKVGVRVGPTTPVTEWKDVGFEVDSYHGAALGPGVQCIGLNVVEVEGETVEAAVAHYLFGDGEHMVQVVVGATFAQAFHLMMPGLHQFIDSLQVQRPDGRSFAAVPDPAVHFVANEEWELVQGVEQQE